MVAIKWTYCNKPVPEYEDLINLSRAINYMRRRLWAILDSPNENGYEDVFSAQEAINYYVEKIEKLLSEYRYMVLMYVGGGRTVR